MHCFAFTPVENATDAEWQAFFKATDALPGKIPGLTKVWYGKLRGPLSQYSVDAEGRKKLAGGAKSATAEVSRAVRSWGVCMEMNGAATLKAYTANPAHKQWGAAYEKVRVEGTTTFDILKALRRRPLFHQSHRNQSCQKCFPWRLSASSLLRLCLSC
jgi:hypothetical protein